MKIYTSYFGFVKKLPETIIPISISRYARFWKGREYKNLAPDPAIMNYSEERYSERFNAYLESLNIERVIEELLILSSGKDCALLCYEKPEDFCHRKLVARWIQNKKGIEVSEFVDQSDSENPGLFS
ncbi:MAG: DUF488 family protein [Leptospira sp.]|nr:DUF488 family protein [Leptospira sp.]